MTTLYLVELQKGQWIGCGKGIRTTAYKRWARRFTSLTVAEQALNKHREIDKLGLLDDAKIIPVEDVA
jgi:hypothetical protein